MNAARTVLLVEDDPRLQLLGKRVLERNGFEVIVADDGLEAVRVATESSPNLILMDIELPGIDGLEATRRIKAATPAVPVIAVTAHAMSGDRERFLASGCDGFLSKPYDIGELIACVTIHIRGRADS